LEATVKLKIGSKLGLGFGLILVLMAITSLSAYWKMQQVEQITGVIVHLRVPLAGASKDLQRDLNYVGNKTRHAILSSGQAARQEKALASWNQGWERVDADMRELEKLAPMFVLQANRDRVAHIKEQLPRYKEVQDESIKAANSGARDAVVQAGNHYADVGTPLNDAIVKVLDELADSAAGLFQHDQDALLSANRSLLLILIIATCVAIGTGIFIAFFLSRGISGATASVLHQAEAIASGDLTGEDVIVTSQDELGDLTTAMNRMHASLTKVIESISQNAQNVANASEEFSSVSQQISANSEETSAQAATVANATEQVNRNLQTVATATEEMSASIQEIAKNATQAAKVASDAMISATETNAIVNKLGVSSAEIGQVIKVITSIAQKTDLLALNATVEAARAGEVGAGFAVVANEVKELAKQTATATEDISRKIEAIQTDTKAAVTAIGSISGIIAQVNEISGTIAAAVEEQSATTNEMSRSLTEAARGAGDVAKNIQGVAEAASNTSHGATDSQKAASALAEMSTQLRQLVGQFKVSSNGRAHRPAA
jgi:methyl-accepting chemotaxis protein